MSIIKDIEVIPIKMPLKQEFKGSYYSMSDRVTVITRVVTKSGIVGEIYNGDELDTLDQIVDMIENQIKPIVVGEDIFNVKRIWEKILPVTYNILADRKMALNAMACVDSAIYDAIGKSLNMPLYKLWGGGRSKLPVMLIGGYYTEGKDVDEATIKSDIEAYIDMGVAGCKFKVGGKSPEIDAERVKLARKYGGEKFILSVDANQGWSRLEALVFAEKVKNLNIIWFEEPCRWDNDVEAMRDIRYMSGIPINAGQSEISAAGCIHLMKSGAIDYCNYDASWSGGPTSWLQVASTGAALDIKMAHHEEPQIAAHLLATAPTGTFLEVFHPDRDPLFYEIVANRNPFKNGYYDVPHGAGWGIELDKDVINKYRIDK